MSPPTRDTDPDPHLLPRDPQDERALSDIRELRAEINTCLDHVLQLEEAAQRGAWQKISLATSERTQVRRHEAARLKCLSSCSFPH